MLKIIRKYIKSKIDLNRELAGYIRTGTAVGLLAAGAAAWLVLDDRLRRRQRAADEFDAEQRERDIDSLSGEIGEIGDLLAGMDLVSSADVAEIGTLGALKKAIETRQKS